MPPLRSENRELRTALVSGVSGPIGAALIPSLRTSGYSVVRLVRGAATGEGRISWDPAAPIQPATVSGFDAVIHLAGESIVGRWTAAKKSKIRDSRVLGTAHLAQALARAQEKPGVFICASAVGYYGDRGDEVLREDSSPGAGFLAQVCQEWENATRPANAAAIRTVQIRTGMVLSPSGGALSKMLTPFKMGVGGKIGNGGQWMSWIDVQDMVGAIHHILKTDLPQDDPLQGPVNLVAPNPVTNAEFTKTLAKVLSRPAIFPMPAFAARLAFGQMADELLLASQRVEPTKLVASGYSFRYPELQASLEEILRK
ncbi:MAG: TIGR01777 family oxidoreductase [Candidatus Sulfotelmatobacter sp.]